MGRGVNSVDLLPHVSFQKICRVHGVLVLRVTCSKHQFTVRDCADALGMGPFQILLSTVLLQFLVSLIVAHKVDTLTLFVLILLGL